MTNEHKDPSPVKAGWTDGPWTAFECPDHSINITGPGGVFVAEVPRWVGATWPNRRSNAALIASSPALAEALEELRRVCSDIPAIERNPRFQAANQAALRALALARGEG